MIYSCLLVRQLVVPDPPYARTSTLPLFSNAPLRYICALKIMNSKS